MFNRIRMIMAVALAQAFGGKTPLSLQRMASDHNRTVDALRAASAAESIGRRLAAGAARLVPARTRRRAGAYWGPNGAQAVARRLRQIRRGQLTSSNGLLFVDSQGRRWYTDSYGVHRGFYWDSSVPS